MVDPRIRGRLAGRAGRTSFGQATVEFVLVLPFVLVLVLAVLQIAILGIQRIAVVNAAREGAREAAVNGDRAAIEAAVGRQLGAHGGHVAVNVSGDRVEGGSVAVTVTHTVNPGVPLAGALFPRDIKLRAAVAMRVEEP